jgi:hypothetical protein
MPWDAHLHSENMLLLLHADKAISERSLGSNIKLQIIYFR